MPLNQTQRSTLFDILAHTVDSILSFKRPEFLRECIKPSALDRSKAAAVLKAHPQLWVPLLPGGETVAGGSQIAVPPGVRAAWSHLGKLIFGYPHVRWLLVGVAVCS